MSPNWTTKIIDRLSNMYFFFLNVWLYPSFWSFQKCNYVFKFYHLFSLSSAEMNPFFIQFDYVDLQEFRTLEWVCIIQGTARDEGCQNWFSCLMNRIVIVLAEIPGRSHPRNPLVSWYLSVTLLSAQRSEGFLTPSQSVQHTHSDTDEFQQLKGVALIDHFHVSFNTFAKLKSSFNNKIFLYRRN